MKTRILGLFLSLFTLANSSAQTTIKSAVTDSELVANFIQPDSKSVRPGIIVLGGSGGGINWQNSIAELLAENGYSALALAYFGMEGLPQYLSEIPLEYFEKALNWLRSHPQVDSERIGVIGVSKGGELALLLASLFPDLKVVVVYVPSNVIFQSIAKEFSKTSSWSYHNRPLPFVPYKITENFNPDNLAEMYDESLEQEEYLEKAVIRVENIKGPILLLSGKEDKVWPSTKMSQMIMERLKRHKFHYAYEHKAYENAGHLISWIDHPEPTKRGGTKEGMDFAQKDSRKRFLKFFKRHLKNQVYKK